MNIKEEILKVIDVNCYTDEDKPEDNVIMGDDFNKLANDLNELIKDELTSFLDFLLKEGYCDTDVYAEPPTALDQYLIFNHEKSR